MFVFRREDLPADPEFSAELDKLGYFINDQDQIRKISDPTEEFQFKINKNERWNQVQREAMNGKYPLAYATTFPLRNGLYRVDLNEFTDFSWRLECIRNIVLPRLRALGLVTLRLPLMSGPTKPHVPILVSKNLSTASRIILVFGEPAQDLGIWAYRTVGSENINAGSAVNFVKAILSPEERGHTSGPSEVAGKVPSSQKGEVAVVLANPGQLSWNCGLARAMTQVTRMAVSRASAVHPPLRETGRNRIPGHENWQDHVSSVFEGIFTARGQLVRSDAKIDVIGLAEGGCGAIRYLANNWPAWRQYISAICLSHPLHQKDTDLLVAGQEPHPESFAAFVSSRCRAYVLSPEPLGTPLPEEEKPGCNCYASGEELNTECIMTKAWPHMLDWLKRAYDYPDYCEAQLVVRRVDLDDGVDGDDGDLSHQIQELEV